MAFLGGLGKTLGLDSEFGKGLIGGLATSVDKGIQDDMKRTQDNIDNLVEVSYKGSMVEGARFKKELKENEEVIKEIAGLVGGEDGVKHPLAYKAAQSLISQYGSVNAALNKAKVLKNYQNLYTTSPIELMKLESDGDDSLITAKLLAENITTPVTIPNMKELGKSANVGFMKSNWFGPSSDASGEIETRSNALLAASGIDINERVLPELPIAVESKIDPLVLGTQDNPTAELIRLQRILQQNNELGADKDMEKQNKVTLMIDNVRSLIDSSTTKKRMTDSAFNGHIKTNLATLGTIYKLGITYKTVGSFPDVAGTQEKKLLALKTSQYYANKLAEATLKGDKNTLYTTKVLEAIADNRELVSTTNDAGVYTLEVGEEQKLSDLEKNILNEGVSNDPNVSNMPGATTLEAAEKDIVDQMQKSSGKLSSTMLSKLRSNYTAAWKNKNPLKDVQSILDAQKISYSQLAFNKFNDYINALTNAGKT